jgi:hypothetical protein
MKYRTIVADPPWRTTTGPPWASGGAGHEPLPYPVMSLQDIKALPVGDIADTQAHLYLWTTNILVPVAYEVATGVGLQAERAADVVQEPDGVRPRGRLRHHHGAHRLCPPWRAPSAEAASLDVVELEAREALAETRAFLRHG